MRKTLYRGAWRHSFVKSARQAAILLAVAGIILAAPGCGLSGPTAPSATAAPGIPGLFSAPPSLSPAAQQQIAQLRALMAPFHNPEKAAAYGYDIPAPGPGVCISDPARGGMGYHYTSSKKNLILDGQVNVLEPEFIVFAPEKNGGVRLAAADYFVPYSTWTSSTPPSLLGVPFEREDAFQAYVMHIWAFWPNPAGMFENFNPDVPLCP